MLKDQDATVTIPVKDIEVARKFYDETVGLERAQNAQPGMLSYKSGGSTVMVYQSRFAGTNKATAATWEVGDVEREVSLLKEKGVAFEHYDMPGVEWNNDVASMGDMGKAAWFKDSENNILCIDDGFPVEGIG